MLFGKKTHSDLVPGFRQNELQAIEEFDSYDAETGRFKTQDVEEAKVISSRLDLFYWDGSAEDSKRFFGPDHLHKPVLDLDFYAELIPSSTKGHFHLYLDKKVPWSKYEKLLDALADCGIIEEGYARASKERGFTAVRLPWIKKEKKP